MKRILCIVLAIIMSASSMSLIASAQNEPSSWAKEMVQKAIEAGVVPERLQGNYKKAITRGEFAELMVNSVVYGENYMVEPESDFYIDKKNILNGVELMVEFDDATEDYIKIAYILGIVNGVSEHRFLPEKIVTRQEAAVMMANTYQFGMKAVYTLDNYEDKEKIASWARDAVSLCYTNRFMIGSNNLFRPEDSITREEAIYMAFNGNGHAQINGGLRARGVILLDPRYFDKVRFTVGKDYIYLNYSDEDLKDYYLEYWKYYNDTEYYKNPTKDQTRVAYQCWDVINVSGNMLAKIAIEKKKAKVISEFMDVYFWEDDYLIKVDLSRKSRYFSCLVGPRYGNPAKPVNFDRVY